MARYILTGIDDELWQRFKAACNLSGYTIKQSFLHHINFTVSKSIADMIHAQQNSDNPNKGKEVI